MIKQGKSKDGSMPAKSEAQQRFMGMALAAKRGKGHFSKKVMEAAESMSEKQLKDFAKTKHDGLPEKKAYLEGFMKRAAEYGYSAGEIAGAVKIAENYVPSEEEQNTVLNNYLNSRNPILRFKGNAMLEAVNKTEIDPEFKAEKYLGTTTPAHVLAGVYGPNLPNEINKANQYNTKYNFPLITPNILNNTNVFKTKRDYTMPTAPVTGINNSADGVYALPKRLSNSLTTNVVNGFQPLKPGVNIGKPEINVFNNFSDQVNKNALMPMQDVLEHEVAGHRVYEPANVTRLPKEIAWPTGMQPYQSQRGEALNGLAAIQRDQFQGTGTRYTDPAMFRQDVNKVLNSPDIEKAIDTQGWGRTDAKRLMRSLVPMDPKKRTEWINQASKAIPGMVKNNTGNTQIKVGSYYYDKQDIGGAVKALENYFKSNEYKAPDVSSIPDFPEPTNIPDIPDILDVNSSESAGLPHALGYLLARGALGAAIGVPAYYINKSLHVHEERPQVKTAGMLAKIKEYMKKHEDEPSESVLKGFVKKQKEGLPALLKMRRLDRMRELGRQMDEK